MSDLLLIILVSLPVGALAGYMAGLFGIGGGGVIVPALYYLFLLLGYDHNVIMHVAIGTALAVIVPTALSSSYAHYKKGAIEWGWVKRFVPFLVLGALFGGVLAFFLTTDLLRRVFAVILIMMALSLLKGRRKIVGEIEGQAFAAQVGRQLVDRLYALFSGVVSALVGIGGATINVPYMVAHGLVINRAVASASLMGLFIALPGVAVFLMGGTAGPVSGLPFTFGYVHILAWPCLVLPSIFFAPKGADLAHRVDVNRFKVIYALFIILVASIMAI